MRVSSELSIAECTSARKFDICRNIGLQCRISAGTGKHLQVPTSLVPYPHPPAIPSLSILLSATSDHIQVNIHQKPGYSPASRKPTPHPHLLEPTKNSSESHHTGLITQKPRHEIRSGNLPRIRADRLIGA
ncbi:hypothetical protein HBI56_223720 [Parastagonospora nodorum]|nr:hypothetical protein HBH53_134730 [Parastagonospora nodorum]KAH3983693.1 hypothetical protein HBH52_065310 [Parastagonospora nodorum]KAH3985550.1 hypothetical protein HBH51_024090 [Parastagonospora nodorum]KAH4003902.1 hypothetical protein HBI10_063270 [Parastagonospora nodorum]KAH4028704.1 hypothetical protein HBI13_039140 [Parastagonospora nodorum]